MPPKVKKAKKLTPKQVIANLEFDLATLQSEKVTREKALLDTNFSLVNTVQQLRELCQRQQNEFSSQHEVVLTALQAELDASKAQVAELATRCSHLHALEASTRSMHEERLNLLRQLGEVTASRERAERSHAEEMSLLHGTMDSTKARLERVFNETLRTAVADEKKRLAIQLDAEATAALGEVGQLRLLSSNQAKQIAQLLRAVEDAHAETDRAGEEIGRLTRQLVSAGYRLEGVRLVEERERLAQGEAWRWREICVQLHEEVSHLREKLGMLPPRPLPRIQQGRRASMSRRASAGQAMVIAKLLVSAQLSSDEATEAAVSAGHVRPSTATRQRLRPETDPAAAAALRAADRARTIGIAADVENAPHAARAPPQAGQGSLVQVEVIGGEEEGEGEEEDVEEEEEEEEEQEEEEEEEEEEAGERAGGSGSHGEAAAAHSDSSPSPPRALPHPQPLPRREEEEKKGEEEEGGLWTASRVSRSTPLTAAAAAPSSSSSGGMGGGYSGPVGTGFLSYERARAAGATSAASSASGGVHRDGGAARPASAGIMMHSPLVTPPAKKALALAGSRSHGAAAPSALPAAGSRPASAAPRMATGAISLSAARPGSAAVPPPSRLYSAPAGVGAGVGGGAEAAVSPQIPRLPLASPVTHSTAVQHVKDDMPAESIRRVHALERGYAVEGAPAVILSAPTAAGLGFTRPGTAQAASPPSAHNQPPARSPSPPGSARGVLFGNTVRFPPSTSPVPSVPHGTAISPVRRGSVVIDTRGLTGLATSPVKAAPGAVPVGRRVDSVATMEGTAAVAAAAAAAAHAAQPPTARTRAAEGAVGASVMDSPRSPTGVVKGVLFGNTLRFRPATSPAARVAPYGTAIGPVRRGSVLIDGKGHHL